jgi:peptidyl-prolyl cis-trans isomerase A (cyclophilin A)
MPEFDKRAFLAGLGAASLASAQAPVAAPGTRVALATPLGVITVALASDKAPITCADFLRYVDAKRYDGGVFYRAMKLAPEPNLNGLIQGGLKNDPAKMFPPIAHEPTTKTGLKHVNGTISLARYDPGSAQAELFFCVGDQPSLDADPTQPGDNQGFAAFGAVTDGMDVARKILVSPTSPTEGEGAMKGQMLSPPIPILTARRV